MRPSGTGAGTAYDPERANVVIFCIMPYFCVSIALICLGVQKRKARTEADKHFSYALVTAT